MHMCVFSGVNSIDFAIFLGKMSQNFKYEKIAEFFYKKKPCHQLLTCYFLMLFMIPN
jgi:hypothetical protein